MRFLAQSAEDLNSSLDLQEVFHKIGERIRTVIDCQLFCVMLWNDDTRLLEHSYATFNGEPQPQDGGFPLGHGVSGSAAALRRPVRVADVRQDPRYVRVRYPEVEVRSELAVPLVFKDRLIGVLDLESVELDAFTELHEEMISALASHIATALENARLYDQLLRDEKRLEDDLAMARVIQRGLLPETPPSVPGIDIGVGYAPARQLGGDFFDFLPYGADRLALAVGDVAGKATAAALYGSLAVGMLRGYVIEHPHRPSEMLRQMNEQLCQPRVENRYVALSFSVYDPRSRSLTLANAGFSRPFLARGGRVETVPVVGVPLGLLPGMKYEERQVTLEVGDVVAFCSDGLLECVPGNGAPHGSGHLRKVLGRLQAGSAQTIADELLGATDNGDREATDDRTVVVMRVAA